MLFLLVWILWIGRVQAAAPEQPIVGIVPIGEGTSLEAWTLTQFEARVAEGFERGPFQVARGDRLGDAVACDDAQCLAAAAGTSGVDYLVRTRIEVDGRAYRVSMELFDASGTSVARVENDCEICGVAEVGDLISDVAARLTAKLEAGSAPVLVVRSSPDGARVRVDGELAGTTPTTIELSEGTHDVRVAKPGFIPQQRTIDAVGGVRETLDLTLQPEPRGSAVLVVQSAPSGAAVSIDGEPVGKTPLTHPIEPGRHELRVELSGHRPQIREVVLAPDKREEIAINFRRAGQTATILGGVSLGGGLAAIGAGIALLVIDGREDTSDCSGDNVDADGDCKYEFTTLGGGIAATVTGAVLAGVGVALLVIGKRRAKKSRARARIRPTAGGLVVQF